MATLENKNVYVGNRYVPKIFGEWNNQNSYEGLSIVTYQGASYTSKQAVPVGVEITNEDFWVLTGNYNAQLETYRQNVTELDNEFTSLKKKISNNKVYNVLDYNVIGDGVTDDTLNIQNVLNELKDGDTIEFPKGIYLTKGTLTVTKSITIIMNGYILADHSNVGILFKNNDMEGNFSSRDTDANYILDVEIDLMRVKNKDYEKQPSCVGVEIWNAFYAKFNIKRIINNYTGLKLLGEKYGTSYSATTYCKFYLGVISSYNTNILLEAKGTTGYVTQNQFYSGSLTGPDVEDTTHVNFRNIGTSSMDENVFFGTSFEGGYRTCVKGLNTSSNRFISCRYELPKIIYLFDFQESRLNQFLNGYGLAGIMKKMAYNNNSENSRMKDNYVSFIDFEVGYVEYFDDIFYVKPLSNKSDKYYSAINGVRSEIIPEGWRVEIIKDGLSDGYVQMSAANVIDSKYSFRIDLIDKLLISESPNYPVTELVFTKPPKHSKEGYLILNNGTYTNLTLNVNTDFSGITDKTGNNLTIPSNVRMIKYFYESFNNRIYILEMM